MYDHLAAKKKALDDVKSFARSHMAKELKGKYHSPGDQEAAQPGTSEAKSLQRGSKGSYDHSEGQDVPGEARSSTTPLGDGHGAASKTRYDSFPRSSSSTYAQKEPNGLPSGGKDASAYPDTERSGDDHDASLGPKDHYAELSAVKSHSEKDGHSSVYAKGSPTGVPGYGEGHETLKGQRSTHTDYPSHDGAQDRQPYSDSASAQPLHGGDHPPVVA